MFTVLSFWWQIVPRSQEQEDLACLFPSLKFQLSEGDRIFLKSTRILHYKARLSNLLYEMKHKQNTVALFEAARLFQYRLIQVLAYTKPHTCILIWLFYFA